VISCSPPSSFAVWSPLIHPYRLNSEGGVCLASGARHGGTVRGFGGKKLIFLELVPIVFCEFCDTGVRITGSVRSSPFSVEGSPGGLRHPLPTTRS
jgi:hypothetical protein